MTNSTENVLSQTITVPTVGQNTGFVAVQGYNYDSLNRLKDATEMVTPDGGSQTQSWKQTYTFDRYGNRRFDFANGNTTVPAANCSEPVCNPTISTANNRLTSTGWLYDAAGNTTRDGSYQTFTYDAENKQVEVKNSSSVTLGQYRYDGDGKRVKKVVPSTGEVTVFVYDAAGKLVAEYSTIVESAEDAKVAYLTADHLGSPRINTDQNGAVTSRHDYHPFGEEVATSQRTVGHNYAGDTVRKQFTGYERDNETELDFAQARYYSNEQGRFGSTDSFNIIFEKKRGKDSAEQEKLLVNYLSIPQHWNRYIYVLNNPLQFVDPFGDDVYVVLYTKGNKDSDDQFKRAAETKAAAIRNDGKFDAKKDRVLVVGVSTKKDVQAAFDSAKAVEAQFGKVAQVQTFSHSGPISGPILPGEPKSQNQFSNSELANLRINWKSEGEAWFYGCNTANFAQNFANAQSVRTNGYDAYAYFSNSDTQMVPDTGGENPVYLVAGDYGDANGLAAAARYKVGAGQIYKMKAYTPDQWKPKPQPLPRPY